MNDMNTIHVIKYLAGILYCCLSVGLNGQDIHFSSIHASPTFLNPAMTGLINGQIRTIAIARSQWQIQDEGYQTLLASADTRLNTGFTGRDDFGLGVQFSVDQAGDLKLRTTESSLSFSYLRSLNRRGDHILAVGARYGYVQQRIDLSELRVFQQDPLLHGADFAPNFGYFDLSLGVGWFKPLNRWNTIYLGGSIAHLNRQQLRFRAEDQVFYPGDHQYRKYVVHGGGIFRINPVFSVLPSFLWASQGPHNEFSIGGFTKITKEAHSRFSYDLVMYVGFWVKSVAPAFSFQRDALIPSFRIDYRNIQAALSLDLTISKFGRATYGVGGPELSIIYLMPAGTRRNTRVQCPAL